MCRKCKTHGHNIPVKRHKRTCPYTNCKCIKCHLVDQGRKVVAKQIALYRDQTGNSHQRDTHEQQASLNRVQTSANIHWLQTSTETVSSSPSSSIKKIPTTTTAALPIATTNLGRNRIDEAKMNKNATTTRNTTRLSDTTGIHDPSFCDERINSTLVQLSTHSNSLRSMVTMMDDKQTITSGPHCRRCRNHSIAVTWKGHKKTCPFRNCPCDPCRLINVRKDTEKTLREMVSHNELKPFTNVFKENRNNYSTPKLQSIVQKNYLNESLLPPSSYQLATTLSNMNHLKEQTNSIQSKSTTQLKNSNLLTIHEINHLSSSDWWIQSTNLLHNIPTTLTSVLSPTTLSMNVNHPIENSLTTMNSIDCIQYDTSLGYIHQKAVAAAAAAAAAMVAMTPAINNSPRRSNTIDAKRYHHYHHMYNQSASIQHQQHHKPYETLDPELYSNLGQNRTVREGCPSIDGEIHVPSMDKTCVITGNSLPYIDEYPGSPVEHYSRFNRSPRDWINKETDDIRIPQEELTTLIRHTGNNSRKHELPLTTTFQPVSSTNYMSLAFNQLTVGKFHDPNLTTVSSAPSFMPLEINIPTDRIQPILPNIIKEKKWDTTPKLKVKKRCSNMFLNKSSFFTQT
ncbi:hypothetical protein Smp_138230 [Schistosoma mansoni]|uniref:hypothetical protein n=1 Tax=Schistosoma mansoni TaxID=6183 RepID=UPI0001A63EA5|nr:hypothetical protein Smp_138230 [Schistosoma mansoni]|eukprot:XP_018651285.1 hypothetical protein Smp_138230 [Schistosoma mansoni]